MNTNQEKPRVSVCVITYNQESYIGQCLQSIVDQMTDFHFEVIVSDDCSTDLTGQICSDYEHKYPDKIRLFLNERNKGMVRNFIDTLNLCNGQYIAICEGDDYWNDPGKLKKQCEFLDANPEFGLVFTDADHFHEVNKMHIYAYDNTFRRRVPRGDVLNELLYGDPYKTCTSLFRSDLINDYDQFIRNRNFKMGDYPLWLFIAKKSKIGYIDESTATYRIRENSASHSIGMKKYINFRRSAYKVSIYFSKYYNVNINRKKLKRSYRHAVLSYLAQHKRYKALLSYSGCHPLGFSLIVKEYLRRLIIWHANR